MTLPLIIFVMFISLASAQVNECVDSESTVCLSQSDFEQGTYICNEEKTYVLTENISFAPVAHNNFHPDCSTSYTDSVYCDNPAYSLGFFAIISITANNVEIDLNGFTIEATPEFAANQRFMSVIELGDSPFITDQGPGNFGEFSAISNVKIFNGVLGRSSHHGIHGNNADRVHISHLTIHNFEVAGIHLNGCLDVVIEDVVIEDSSQEVNFVATLSQAQNLVSIMEHMDQTQTVRINGRGEVSVETLKHELQLEIDDALQRTQSYNGIFKNIHNGRSDGSFLGGIVVQGGIDAGVAIGEYAGQNPDEAAKTIGGPVSLKNVLIQNFVHHTHEHVHLRFEFPESAGTQQFVTGPFGGLLLLSLTTDDGDLGEYQETTLYNAMYALCSLEPTLGHTCHQTTWNFLADWISGDVVDLAAFLSEQEDVAHAFVGNKDAMSHHLKGVAGLRIEHISELTLDGVHVDNLRNYGVESFHHTQYVDEPYRGGDVFGIVLGNVTTVVTEGPVTIAGLQAEQGIAAGIAFNGNLNTHVTNGDWDVQDIQAPNDASDSIMTQFLNCPATGEVIVKISWDDVATDGTQSCPLAEHRMCNESGEQPHELCLSGSFDYTGLGDGFCRDANGDMDFLGDWDADSIEECESYCNNIYACEGYQYGRDANPKDCNLYASAQSFALRQTTHSHCMKKNQKLSHDGYTFLGNGYCRGDEGAKDVLTVINVNSEYGCKLQCDERSRCAGFQFGNYKNIKKCALYELATETTSGGGFGGCWSKNA